MALPDTKPLFQSYRDLLSRQRLSGLYENTGSDAHAILEKAIGQARLEMISYAGATVVTELAAVPYDPNPAPNDEEGNRRLMAVHVETDLVRILAMDEMRTFLADGTAGADATYQQGWLLGLAGPDFYTAKSALKRKSENQLAWLKAKTSIESIADVENSMIASSGVDSSGNDYRSPDCRPTPYSSLGLNKRQGGTGAWIQDFLSNFNQSQG